MEALERMQTFTEWASIGMFYLEVKIGQSWMTYLEHWRLKGDLIVVYRTMRGRVRVDGLSLSEDGNVQY